MASLARRNLFHDKVRLGVTLTGIVFALVLIAVQGGLFLGFTTTTSNIIDHSKADIWISSRGLQNFDSAAPFSERKFYQALAIPGIASAEKYIVGYGNWKKPDGGVEGVEIVGFNPDNPIGGPWNITAGSADSLKTSDTVFIDELFKEKLGVTQLGQTVEINGYRARVVGFTRGIRSFTTNPFVFTSFKNSLNYVHLTADQTIYILAKVVPVTDVAALKQQILSRLRDVDVFTNAELSSKTQFYWMFTTGAGMTLIIAALMGLIVGVVVVTQTIYATTIDHIKEFGTLKAMGASNFYIYRVIIKQAIYSAVIGYALGISVSYIFVYLSRDATVAILVPWQMAVMMFLLTLVMCSGASVVSINKVTHIDPAMVFKG